MTFREDFVFEDIVYATLIKTKDAPKGLTFPSSDEENIQVGVWNYEKGKILDLHYHKDFSREATRTGEAVCVIRGSLVCNLYTKEGDFLVEIPVKESEVIIQYYGAHEYIIEEDSVIIEIKNGPYFGPEKDRVRINAKKI
jgi:hypothetical protein